MWKFVCTLFCHFPSHGYNSQKMNNGTKKFKKIMVCSISFMSSNSWIWWIKSTCWISCKYRVISKIRQTQHQNLEFGHTQGDFFFKLAKKYINIQWGVKLRKPSILMVNWISSCLSFFLNTSIVATYIFTSPTCTT
jgi:hypothetical protein